MLYIICYYLYIYLYTNIYTIYLYTNVFFSVHFKL